MYKGVCDLSRGGRVAALSAAGVLRLSHKSHCDGGFQVLEKLAEEKISHFCHNLKTEGAVE